MRDKFRLPLLFCIAILAGILQTGCELDYGFYDSDCNYTTGEGCDFEYYGEQMHFRGVVYLKEDSSIVPMAKIMAYAEPPQRLDTTHTWSRSEGNYELSYRVSASDSPYPNTLFTYAQSNPQDSVILTSILITHTWRDGKTKYVDYYLE